MQAEKRINLLQAQVRFEFGGPGEMILVLPSSLEASFWLTNLESAEYKKEDLKGLFVTVYDLGNENVRLAIDSLHDVKAWFTDVVVLKRNSPEEKKNPLSLIKSLKIAYLDQESQTIEELPGELYVSGLHYDDTEAGLNWKK